MAVERTRVDSCKEPDIRVSDIFPFCLICNELIIDPVTLPCGHELCLRCFNSNMESANFCCCFCRKRVSTWARKNRTNPVNTDRKKELETLYTSLGSLCDVKLAVQLQKEEDSKILPVCVDAGELHNEYQKELEQVEREKLLEEKLSAEEMLRFETDAIEFHRKRQIQVIEDEKFAREFFSQQNYENERIEQIDNDFKLAVELDGNLNSKKGSDSQKGKPKNKKKKRIRKKEVISDMGSPVAKLTKWFTPLPQLP